VLFDGASPAECLQELMVRDKRVESNSLAW